MANLVKIRRGLEAARTGVTPTAGEPLWTTDTKKLYVGDGSTAGGIAVGGSSGFTTTGVKTGAYTAVANDRVPVNTTSTAVTITLPASPAAGTKVAFLDYLRTWSTNNLTVGRNGQDIENVGEDMVVSDSVPFTLEYIDATVGWKLI